MSGPSEGGERGLRAGRLKDDGCGAEGSAEIQVRQTRYTKRERESRCVSSGVVVVQLSISCAKKKKMVRMTRMMPMRERSQL